MRSCAWYLAVLPVITSGMIAAPWPSSLNPSRICAQRGLSYLCATSPTIADMRLKELKAELDERGIAWRGAMFDRETLEAALETARNAPPVVKADEDDQVQQTSESTADAEDGVTANRPDDVDEEQAYERAYAATFEEAMALKVKELRTELAARGTGWADCIEKSDLAARLATLMARAALFSRSGALTPGKVSEVTGAELKVELDDARTPMVIDVYATWCGPVRAAMQACECSPVMQPPWTPLSWSPL